MSKKQTDADKKARKDDAARARKRVADLPPADRLPEFDRGEPPV